MAIVIILLLLAGCVASPEEAPEPAPAPVEQESIEEERDLLSTLKAINKALSSMDMTVQPPR